MTRRACSLCLCLALAWGAGCAGDPAAPAALPYAPPPRSPAARPQHTGRIIRVPEDQPTVQAAIDAAAGDEAIVLAPGRYPGGLRLGGKALTLASRYLTTGRREFIDQTIIDAGQGDYALLVTRDAGPDTRIVGLTLRGGRDGIRCMARCQILDNRIVGSGDGIDYEGGGGLCRGNRFEDCRDDAIDLDGDCDVVIEDNVLRDSHDDGIEIRLYEYTGKATLHIVVRDNLIAGSREDGIQIIDHPGPSNRRLWIERNVIRGTAEAAIGCMNDAETGEDYRSAAIPDPVAIVNNTLIDNHYGLCGGGNLVAANNVFARTRRTAVKGAAGGAVLDHNLFWENGRDAEDCDLPAGTTVRRDPRLDADGVPAAGSPCIDAGTAEVRWPGGGATRLPPDSYAGKAPDLGAREWTPAPATQPDARPGN